MSAELIVEYPAVEIELFPEGKGIFDVVVDGALIFSKFKAHRFPENGEITQQLKS